MLREVDAWQDDFNKLVAADDFDTDAMRDHLARMRQRMQRLR